MEYDKKIFSENLKKQAAIAGENQPDIAEFLGVTNIVVALVDNEETTVKRLKKVSDGIILEAENPEYNSLYFNEKQIQNEKVKIIGKAVESRKKL